MTDQPNFPSARDPPKWPDIATIARRLGAGVCRARGRPPTRATASSPRTTRRLKAGGPRRGRRAARTRRRAARKSPNSATCCAARSCLQLDRAGFRDAHPSGRHSGLALAAPEGGGGRAAAEARRQRTASSFCPAAARTGSAAPARPRRSKAATGSRPARCSPPARAAGDVLMTGAVLQSEGEPDKVIHFAVPMKAPEVKVARDLANARHARHGLQRRRDRRSVRPRRQRRLLAQGRRMASGVPDHRDRRVPADLCRLSRRRRERPRHRASGLAKRKRRRTRMVDLAGRMDTACGPRSSRIGG